MKFSLAVALCGLIALAQTAAADPQTDLNQALVAASKANDLAKVQTLLGQGAEVNLQGVEDPECFINYNGGSPALREAVRGGFLPVMETLLKAGATAKTMLRIGATEDDCEPLLTYVTRAPSLDMLKLLIEYKADLNLLDSDYDGGLGHSAVWWSTALGNLDELKLLLSAGAATDAVGDLGATDPVLGTKLPPTSAIGAALWFHQKDAFQALLSGGAPTYDTVAPELPAVYIAAFQDDLPSLQALARHGANLSQRVDLPAESPLSIAIQQKHHDIIDYLLGQSVSVGSVTDCDHAGDLLLATQAHDLTTVNRLLGLGVSADGGIGTGCPYVTITSYPALLEAVTDGYDDIVAVLLDAHANSAFTDKNGQSLLMTAADSAFPQAATITKLLLAQKVNVNQDDGRNYDNNGVCEPSCRRTALTHAVVLDHLEVAKELLAAGANPNALDYAMADGPYLPSVAGSPLLWAAQLGFPDMVSELLSSGADVKVVDDQGANALMRAAAVPPDSFAQIAQALVKKRLDIKATDTLGAAILHRLLIMPTLPAGTDQKVKTLLSLGADPNAKTPAASTPLMYASGLSGGQGDLAAVQLLLSKKADPRARNKAGFAAADFAHALGLKDIEAALCAAASDVCQSFRPVPLDLPLDSKEEPGALR